MRILFATFSFCLTVSSGLFIAAPSVPPGECDGLLQCFYAPGNSSEPREILTSSAEELESFCGSRDRSRHCVDDYTRSCLTASSRALFYRMYGDTNLVLETVCDEEHPREEFQSHATCFERSQRGLLKLTREFLSGGVSTGRICDVVRRFVRSLQDLVQEECDEGAAEYVRALLQKMSANVISVCQHADALNSAAASATHTTRIYRIVDFGTRFDPVASAIRIMHRIIASFTTTYVLIALWSHSNPNIV